MIQVYTANIDAYLSSQGLPSPSWDLDTPSEVLLSGAAQVSQNALLESMEELKALILGPVPFLMNKATDTVKFFGRLLGSSLLMSVAAKRFARPPCRCEI